MTTCSAPIRCTALSIQNIGEMFELDKCFLNEYFFVLSKLFILSGILIVLFHKNDRYRFVGIWFLLFGLIGESGFFSYVVNLFKQVWVEVVSAQFLSTGDNVAGCGVWWQDILKSGFEWGNSFEVIKIISENTESARRVFQKSSSELRIIQLIIFAQYLLRGILLVGAICFYKFKQYRKLLFPFLLWITTLWFIYDFLDYESISKYTFIQILFGVIISLFWALSIYFWKNLYARYFFIALGIGFLFAELFVINFLF